MTPAQVCVPAGDRQSGHHRPQTGIGWGVLLWLVISLLGLVGCAEVTKPTPTAPQIEAAQLDAARRHPYHSSWYKERVSRVFLRLMPWLPVTQGRTYPFLGFNWWVNATGKVAVDQVWYPSPAQEAGLRRGDVIVAVNNWSLPTWVEGWDKVIGTTRSIFQNFSLSARSTTGRASRARSANKYAISSVLPGELLAAMLLDLKHIQLETQERYLTGPVELLVEREGQKLTFTLYPQRLPAEYAILVNTQDLKINAYAAPGGIIILTQRLVHFCLNDDEIALVVGHEMAHQVLGHLVRSAAHRELGQLVGEVITAASTLSLGRLLDWKHYQVDPDVRQVAGNAVVSVFSRDEEREADIYGAWYAFQAGYDLDRGAAVWERMAAVDEKDPFLTTYFLDSHPAPLERLARLKLTAQYFKAGRAAEVFLQTADLNRRPPPSMPDALEARSPAPPSPASSGGSGSSRASGSSHRERDGYPRPAGIAVYPDLGPIGSKEPADHEKPQAGPVPAGGVPGSEEGLEDPG